MPKNNRPLVNNFILRVKMPMDIHDKAVDKAKSEGKTISEVVRTLIENYIHGSK